MFLQSSKYLIEIVTKNVPDIILRPKFPDIVTNSKIAILSCFHQQILKSSDKLGQHQANKHGEGFVKQR